QRPDHHAPAGDRRRGAGGRGRPGDPRPGGRPARPPDRDPALRSPRYNGPLRRYRLMVWLFIHGLRRGLLRLVLAAIGVAFPVVMLGATLLFVDGAVHSMTRIALEPVQVEMRAVATSLTVDMNAIDRQLATVKGVQRVDRFGAADVVVSTPGAPAKVPARLFAVDPGYLQNHPWVRVTAGGMASGGRSEEHTSELQSLTKLVCRLL